MPPLVNASDLKQYVYCPRIVYYTWVMPVRPGPTYLMERGREIEQEFARLEPRRLLGRYGLEVAKRHFGLQLTDDQLGLTGRPDLVLEGDDHIAVVEFKATASEVAENQKLQLCAYGLLAEAHFHLPCPTGFLILSDRDELVGVELEPRLRQQTLEVVRLAQDVVKKQYCPEPTPVRGRCRQCEYRHFCGDVF